MIAILETFYQHRKRGLMATCIKRSYHSIASVLLLSLLSFGMTAFAQPSGNPSFGSFLTGRKKVDLQRKLPPVTNVSGKSVAVVVTSSHLASQALQSAIEEQLTRNDSAVRVEASSPDILIDCHTTFYNAPKIDSVTQDKVTTQTLVGALSVAFRITDRLGHLIASNVTSSQMHQQVGSTTGGALGFNPFHKSSGPAMNSTLDGENFLLRDSAKQIASYLVITAETVEAQLASGGSLNGPDALALKGLWARDLEDLTTMGAYSDPRMDAYRLYNIGVANEALAYLAQDRNAVLKYLREASNDYGKAIDAKPDEKYFLDPQNRIKTALAHYADPVPQSPENTGKTSVEATKADAGLTNEDILAMVHARMDYANILDNIQSAPKVTFDLSVNGQIQLTNGGVNSELLKAMKQKARGLPVTPVAAPANPNPATRPVKR